MTRRIALSRLERSTKPPEWYVIQTKPRQEDVAEAYLQTLGLETFLPKFRQRRFIDGALKYSIKPLFPAYVFARFELNRSHRAVKYGRGIRAIVSSGDAPISVDEMILTTIQERMRDGYVEFNPQVQPGDRVRIESGVLREFEGILEREMKGSERVVVLLETVRYQARVLLERRDLKPVHG